MPINRNCKNSPASRGGLSLTSQSIQIAEQHTSCSLPKPTPKQQLHTCTNPKSTEPSSTFRLFSPAANSPRRHLLQDAARISTLAGHRPPVSALLLLPDVDLPLRATADPRGTLIHTGRDLSLDPVPRDATGHAQDQFLRVLDRHQEDEEDVEIALAAMEAGEEEARVTVATAVMMTGAGAGAVGEVAEVDVRGGTLDFPALEFWDDEKIVTLTFKIPRHLFSEPG